MGVSLYDHTEDIEIYGFESLDKSLGKLYGDGGYILTFEKDNFFHMKGLGNLEVITKDNLKPHGVERVDNPVAELQKLGVTFQFIDLAKPENKELRNYVR